MARTISIGQQNFSELIVKNNFYVDKTMFIKEWWENGDDVTLITRPRRFGKTLTINMVETFFSVNYVGREDIFKDLSIWQDEKYQKLQGTWPVIALSFADIKEVTYEMAQYKINQLLANLYSRFQFVKDSPVLTTKDRNYWERVSVNMNVSDASLVLHNLSEYLYCYYGKKVIILLDEYDTPMQEAYVYGYWEELAEFIRSFFNSTFKTNPCLERAIMTGIIGIRKESVFSDLNNLEVVTTTSKKYATSFGFTQQEVSKALEEYGLLEEEAEVKYWYDGFCFGNQREIYNPWFIINYLDKQEIDLYWANTNSDRLVNHLLQKSDADIKMIMEDLLTGNTYHTTLNEQIVFQQLNDKKSAFWSLLLASGYLRVEHFEFNKNHGKIEYDLILPNQEVRIMFEQMIEEWFSEYTKEYNDFVNALLKGDCKAMNHYMNRVTLETFSFFDSGKRPSESTEPERFYHGFVLGLLVELRDHYVVISNRESGFGRYDVMLEPVHQEDDAIILEFKVYDPDEEQALSDTVASALAQIREKAYAASLEAKGISPERIRSYGFAFEGKKVLIGENKIER